MAIVRHHPRTRTSRGKILKPSVHVHEEAVHGRDAEGGHSETLASRVWLCVTSLDMTTSVQVHCVRKRALQASMPSACRRDLAQVILGNEVEALLECLLLAMDVVKRHLPQ